MERDVKGSRAGGLEGTRRRTHTLSHRVIGFAVSIISKERNGGGDGGGGGNGGNGNDGAGDNIEW